MATVTGKTAAAMDAIADASVTTGTVNGSGHLILTTHGGTNIDAGAVVGPTGATGPAGADGTTLSVDAIAVANPTTADWSNSSHKITNLANGSSAQDACTFGQAAQKSGTTFTGWIAPAVVALTFGTTVNVNAAQGNDFRLTLTASTANIANPTNPVDGQRIDFQIKQDATGSRVLAGWGTAYSFGTDGAPTLSTGANKLDLVGFIYNATLAKWICAGWKLGFS